MVSSDALLRRRARRRVKALKGLYIHLSAYVLVNIYLIVSRLVTEPHDLSVLWVTAGWGIGVAAHAFAVFGTPLTSRWEERKVNELVDREKRKRPDRG